MQHLREQQPRTARFRHDIVEPRDQPVADVAALRRRRAHRDQNALTEAPLRSQPCSQHAHVIDMPQHDDYHFMPLDDIILRPLTSFDGMEPAALKCLNECRLLVSAVDDERCASLHLFSPRFSTALQLATAVPNGRAEPLVVRQQGWDGGASHRRRATAAGSEWAARIQRRCRSVQCRPERWRADRESSAPMAAPRQDDRAGLWLSRTAPQPEGS
jgi:hypothetical protein